MNLIDKLRCSLSGHKDLAGYLLPSLSDEPRFNVKKGDEVLFARCLNCNLWCYYGEADISRARCVYISREGGWFDEGKEASLVDDYRDDGLNSGLFRGSRDGKIDEEVCSFGEFIHIPEKELLI